mmetsp:Transcript_144100/g.268437  ORF Transcript_144100/g.268437 Transcript_144100/m.268437 type:complete len:754 (+) Transcript_144100:48-2309(+)
MLTSIHRLVILVRLFQSCTAVTGLGAFRTEKVKTSFDLSKADGLWYEIAFQDVAQKGASCQTLTNTHDTASGKLSQVFSTRYGPVPFSQTYIYEPDESGEKGVYRKHLNGVKFLVQLPTVVVDVLDGEDGRYTLMTEFTSKNILVTDVTELRFLARTPVVTTETFRNMQAVAASVGIKQSIIDSLKIVDHKGCPSAALSSNLQIPPVVSSASFDNALILQPPAGKAGAPAAWIVLPGAQIDKSTYQALAKAVQEEASMPLWVAVLGTYLTPTPIPPEIGPRIDHVLNTMKAQGLDLGSAKIFYGGHSLGSIFIQDHLNSHHGSAGPLGGTIKVHGQVLMGGFLQRKYNWPTKAYPVSTLTVGGELDGLARCTRLGEAFHAAGGNTDFPVVVIPGMTHMQFASGTPPALVQAMDLLPEITYDQAHTAVAKIVASYFGKLAGMGDGSAVTQAVSATAEFVKPIIAAYELEGARYFNEPAQYGGPLENTCAKGACNGKSPWAPKAQELISKVEGWTLSVSNQYVDVSSTPITGAEFHLPTIANDSSTKSITITTYSQSYWDDAKPSWFDWKEIFDKFDTGFIATSAEEIGTKLASRQCTLIQGIGQVDTPFSVDDPQFCAQTNKQAYQWAQQNAGSTALERFNKYGQKYTFADDIPKSGGPFFIKSRLQFNEITDASGEKVISVAAPMQKTEIDYWKRHFGPIPRPSLIPDPGCFHYCKLLSPARATEWIYVDSLRLKRSLRSQAEASQASQSVYV